MLKFLQYFKQLILQKNNLNWQNGKMANWQRKKCFPNNVTRLLSLLLEKLFFKPQPRLGLSYITVIVTVKRKINHLKGDIFPNYLERYGLQVNRPH